MPLYHTMGVRSLLSLALIDGRIVCLPRFDAARALEAIRDERGDAPLSRAHALPRPVDAPRLREHRHPQRAQARLRRRADARRAAAAAAGGLRSRAVRQPLRQFRDLHLRSTSARSRSRVPGRAGLNTRLRVVRSNSTMRPAWSRRWKRARSSPSCAATRPSRVTTSARTRMPAACTAAGTSPATPATWTTTATCSSPAVSTT